MVEEKCKPPRPPFKFGNTFRTRRGLARRGQNDFVTEYWHASRSIIFEGGEDRCAPRQGNTNHRASARILFGVRSSKLTSGNENWA